MFILMQFFTAAKSKCLNGQKCMFSKNTPWIRQNNRTKLNKDLIAEITQVLKNCDIISYK